MSRRKEEFYCGECHHYFLTYLRDNMFGNYTIQCANAKCKHHHFRVIKNGLVTDERHSDKLGEAELIYGLAATLSKTPYHKDPAFLAQQKRRYECG